MSLILSNSESAYLITPVEPLKASLYDYFGISVYFVYLIFIRELRNIRTGINNRKMDHG